MTLPDIDTLRLGSMLSSTAFGVVFLALWLRDRSDRHLFCWAASSFLYAAAMIGFDRTARESIGATTVLFALLSVSNLLTVIGVRLLEGRTPLRWWMAVPVVAAGLGHAGPYLLVGAGLLAADGPASAIGDAAGLALSMAICGAALLRGDPADTAGKPTVGQRIAGAALLAYVPGYFLSLVGEFGLPGMDLLAMIAMLSDQALLGILNLGLLAIPVELAQRQLREAALRDPLTGAWNRAGFTLQQRRLHAAGAAVIAIDIDHFKTINDRHGHAAGDELLTLFGDEAGRLARAHGGELARLGGDEFVILLPAGGGNPAAVAGLLHRRLRARPVAAQGWSVSMGLATVRAGEADFGPGLRRADRSLYEAKARGRDRIAG